MSKKKSQICLTDSAWVHYTTVKLGGVVGNFENGVLVSQSAGLNGSDITYEMWIHRTSPSVIKEAYAMNEAFDIAKEIGHGVIGEKSKRL